MFTFPQSSRSVIAGQEVYRVRAPVSISTQQSALFGLGDLVPVESGISAVAVGPESDFYRYEIFFPDSLAPERLNSTVLTPANPLVLPTDANLSQVYEKTRGVQQRLFGRLLDWPVDTSTGGINSQIDLLFYIGSATPPFIPTVRNEKRITVPLQLFSAQKLDFSIPIYGRREVSFRLFRQNLPAPTISAVVTGIVPFPPITPQGLAGQQLRTELLTSTPVPDNDDVLFVYDRAVHGAIDILRLEVTTDTDVDPSTQVLFYPIVFDAVLRD